MTEPASLYVALQTEVTFYTVTELARRRGQVALGYRRTIGHTASTVTLNPDKSLAMTYHDGDQVIVLESKPAGKADSRSAVSTAAPA